eukprot:TRINITY_DN1080_c1_g1_i3.p1 TRINITY_DN1080_c1_g1~~TRINITY_DN1080_c1_g1_i3.p1  ORF type:complete len:346 (-),score=138.98 TRINITY_DN1080_c1_g1_i3:77-1114(-)
MTTEGDSSEKKKTKIQEKVVASRYKMGPSSSSSSASTASSLNSTTSSFKGSGTNVSLGSTSSFSKAPSDKLAETKRRLTVAPSDPTSSVGRMSIARTVQPQQPQPQLQTQPEPPKKIVSSQQKPRISTETQEQPKLKKEPIASVDVKEPVQTEKSFSAMQRELELVQTKVLQWHYSLLLAESSFLQKEAEAEVALKQKWQEESFLKQQLLDEKLALQAEEMQLLLFKSLQKQKMDSEALDLFLNNYKETSDALHSTEYFLPANNLFVNQSELESTLLNATSTLEELFSSNPDLIKLKELAGEMTTLSLQLEEEEIELERTRQLLLHSSVSDTKKTSLIIQSFTES